MSLLYHLSVLLSRILSCSVEYYHLNIITLTSSLEHRYGGGTEDTAENKKIWYEFEKEEEEKDEKEEDDDGEKEKTWCTWEVVWAGHVRVRDSPRLNASIVGQRDYGTIVRGSVVVQGEDRKDSKWLKLADGSGYMLIEENEEDEEEEDEKVEEKEEEKTEERKNKNFKI